MYYSTMQNPRSIGERKAVSIGRQAPLPVFLAATVVIFFLSLSSADSIGFVPDYIDGSVPLTTSGTANDEVALSNLPQLGEEANSTTAVGVEPVRMLVPAISLDLAVQNPDTRDIAVLDALLEKGPARYVDSAKLGETGTMIIFAHSSHLPIVHNKMFQAFNRVPDLKAGDSITMQGEDSKNYMYSVTKVYQADASNTNIDMSPSLGTRLVLVTCDTLTGKSARFVLEASFVGSYSL